MPKGHNMEFGNHRAPESFIEELHEVPDPKTFHDTYVRHHIPVILRGAAKDWPGRTLWTDEYLKETYGDLLLRMETKDDDKTTEVGSRKFSDFIDNYRSSNLYLVDELPPAMMHEAYLPSALKCDEMSSKFFVTFLWISSGSTSSKLHIDTDENLMCVLEGTKHFLMMEPQYGPQLYTDSGALLGVSPIDTLRVNMTQYPRTAEVPYTVAEAHAGDCFYLPQNWWHYVFSEAAPGPKGRNVAVAMWWKSKPHVEPSDYTFQIKDRSFADVLTHYESYVQRVSLKTPSPTNCTDTRSTMKEYEFASDRNGGDTITEDTKGDRDEGNWVNPQAVELGLSTELYGACHYNLSNPLNPCFVKNCDAADDTYGCLAYRLEYCGMFADYGCQELVWLLNKRQHREYLMMRLLPSMVGLPDSRLPDALFVSDMEIDTIVDLLQQQADGEDVSKQLQRLKKAMKSDDGDDKEQFTASVNSPEDEEGIKVLQTELGVDGEQFTEVLSLTQRALLASGIDADIARSLQSLKFERGSALLRQRVQDKAGDFLDSLPAAKRALVLRGLWDVLEMFDLEAGTTPEQDAKTVAAMRAHLTSNDELPAETVPGQWFASKVIDAIDNLPEQDYTALFTEPEHHTLGMGEDDEDEDEEEEGERVWRRVTSREKRAARGEDDDGEAEDMPVRRGRRGGRGEDDGHDDEEEGEEEDEEEGEEEDEEEDEEE